MIYGRDGGEQSNKVKQNDSKPEIICEITLDESNEEVKNLYIKKVKSIY